MSKVKNETKTGLKVQTYPDKTPEEIKQIVEELNRNSKKED